MEGALEQQEENVETKSNGDDLENNFESDPLIYQLVRVEGDGTMIPATEDEVLQYVDLGNMDSFLSSELIKSDLEQGVSQPENTNMDTENRNTTITSDETKPANTHPPPEILTDPIPIEAEKTDSTSASANDITPPVPDFSLLHKDEISLDGLSIRELQVVFLSTFGRKTNVKDKAWLKRRIAMGLTNSSEVPTSNFTIKNNKIIVNKEALVIQEEGGGIVRCKSPTPSLDSKDSAKKRPRNNSSNSNVSNNLEKDVVNSEEDTGTGTGTQKRMRKPTKRYIEELSDLDNKDMIAVKSRTPDKSSINSRRSRARIDSGIGSWVPALRTRSDSLGGFRVQVPFTSRARRCRPRKNFISFMMQNDLFGVGDKATEEKENEPVLIRKIKTPLLNTPKPNPPKQENQEPEQEQDQERMHEVKLEPDQSDEDDNTASDTDTNDTNTVNSGNGRKRGGRIRRKHHRAWTLCEVLKLVEGVSRYGAGRWSEIRRLVFASYSYRTSVDLKDKWRNLIKAATLAQPSVQREGKNTRKPASMPIPKSILSRVRELAELHSQTGNEFPGPKNPGNKIPGLKGGNKVVQGKGGSGFL